MHIQYTVCSRKMHNMGGPTTQCWLKLTQYGCFILT